MSDWEDDDGEFERSLVGVDFDHTPGPEFGLQTPNLASKVQPHSSTPLQNNVASPKPKHPALNSSAPSSIHSEVTDGTVIRKPVELFKSPAVPSSAKRRFPGPAGKLPKLKKTVDLSRLKHQYIQEENHNNKNDEEVMPSQLSQSHGVNIVLSTAWTSMIDDLQISQQHLDTHCIKNALTNASNNRLPSDGKIPLLLVLIESVDKTLPDATVQLRDMSGSMVGVIHRVLVKQYQHELETGSALLLKRISIFRPCPRKQYLNITPNNLLRIYPEPRNSSLSTPVHITSEPTDLNTLLTQPVCSSPSTHNTDKDTTNTGYRKLNNLLSDVAMTPINQNTFNSNQNHTPVKTRNITPATTHNNTPVKTLQRPENNQPNEQIRTNSSSVREKLTLDKLTTSAPVIEKTSINKKIADIFDDDDLDDLDLSLIE